MSHSNAHALQARNDEKLESCNKPTDFGISVQASSKLERVQSSEAERGPTPRLGRLLRQRKLKNREKKGWGDIIGVLKSN